MVYNTQLSPMTKNRDKVKFDSDMIWNILRMISVFSRYDVNRDYY